MKILQIISSGGLYGAEQVVLNLTRHLERMGHEGQIAVFENWHAPNLHIADAAKAFGLAVELVPCRGRFDWGTVKHLKQFAESYKPDLVHMHGYKADMYGYAAVRSLRAAKVSTCHGWVDNTLPLQAYGLMDRWILRRFDLVVAVATEIAERLRRAGVSPGKIHVIGNGIDVTSFETDVPTLRRKLRLDSTCVLVGAIGRLSPEKGFAVLVPAAQVVVQRHPEVRFVIVGCGPEQKKLQQLTRECGLEGKLFWAGRRDDMAGVYASLDIQVQPSLKEGLPMTILEGLAAHKPIVATRVGAVENVIEDGKTGLLVPASDCAQLALAILRLLEDPALRSQLANAGQEHVRTKFSSERMAGEYLAAYAELLAEQGRK
jgi:glycosyltransferase involved in cell wall biosynthesis